MLWLPRPHAKNFFGNSLVRHVSSLDHLLKDVVWDYFPVNSRNIGRLFSSFVEGVPDGVIISVPYLILIIGDIVALKSLKILPI
jgi:hypothetical protein